MSVSNEIQSIIEMGLIIYYFVNLEATVTTDP